MPASPRPNRAPAVAATWRRYRTSQPDRNRRYRQTNANPSSIHRHSPRLTIAPELANRARDNCKNYQEECRADGGSFWGGLVSRFSAHAGCEQFCGRSTSPGRRVRWYASASMNQPCWFGSDYGSGCQWGRRLSSSSAGRGRPSCLRLRPASIHPESEDADDPKNDHPRH